MEIEIGKRNAFFCNLKVLLIVMVVYGHLIETEIWSSDFLMWQYRIIYAVHMPLFAFLSGVFLKGRKACWTQMKKTFLYYLIFQSISILGIKVLQGDEASLITPYWHLWYLLSLGFWALLCLGVEALEKYLRGYERKVILIIVAMGIACMAGNVERIGREFSLSRTIVFLPYVLMGKYFPENIEIKKFRIWGILAGMISFGLLIMLAPVMPVSFLYQADFYGALGVENGLILRLLSYGIGVGMGFFILIFVPRKRLAVSKMGVNTLWIYILHAPFVLILRKLEFWKMEFPYVAFPMALIVVFMLYKGAQWREKIYRIV